MFNMSTSDGAQTFTCGPGPLDDCVPLNVGTGALVAKALDRLHQVERLRVATLDPLFVPPLIVFGPAPPNARHWDAREPSTLGVYLTMYKRDAWLGPAIRVYNAFFAQRAVTAPRGIFVEAGGFDGGIAGSNSYLFERYLGWEGLMVEANQLNFARLLRARPGVARAETALCPMAGNLSFAGGGCCAGVAGKPAPHTGAGLRDGKWSDSHSRPRSKNEYMVRCTPLGALLRALRVPRIDFLSLDVESAEYAVLSGMDWTIPVSVLMVERCKGSSPALLRSKGFVRATEAEFTTGLCSRDDSRDCPRDKVWYHPDRIRPQIL